MNIRSFVASERFGDYSLSLYSRRKKEQIIFYG